MKLANAYGYSPYSGQGKDYQKCTPYLIFIDLDKNDNFKKDRNFELALSNTLKNIREIKWISHSFIYWWRLSYLSTN